MKRAMSLRHFSAFVLAVFVSLTLAACGGGSKGASTLPQATPTSASEANGKTANVSAQIMIPAAAAGTASTRRPAFVSPSTNGVQVTVYAHSDTNHTTPLATTVTNVSSGSNACTGGAGSRTCTVAVTAPAGSDDFVFVLYDTAPVNGAIPGSAHILGNAGITQTVASGTNNVIAAGIGGLIVGLSGQAALVKLAADGATHDIGLTIAPTDFGNNPITAGSSNSPFANPITVTLTESGGSGHASLQLNGGPSAAQVTVSKATDTVQVVYDGLGTAGYQASVAMTAPAVSGQGGATENAVIEPILFVSNATVFYGTAPATVKTYPAGQHVLTISEPTAAGGTTYTVTPTGCSGILKIGTIIGSGPGATVLVVGGTTISTTGCSLAIGDGTLSMNVAVTNTLRTDSATHTITEYTTTAQQPFGIATGADGNLWFAENNGAMPAISQISSSGTGYTKHALLPVQSGTNNGWESPFGVAIGADGNIWVGDDNSHPLGNIGQVTPAAVINTYHANHQFTNFASPGLDGNEWFSECSTNAVSSVSTTGTVTESSVSGATDIQGMTLGPDGNIWFTDLGSKRVGTVVAGVPSLVSSALTNQPSTAGDITSGSDGNLWVAELPGASPALIAQVSTSGTILNQFGSSGLGSPNFITAGPDGALWFTDTSNNAIGQISTGGTISEFTIPTAGSSPGGITVGPDGNLWFTESSSHKIGVLKL
jgi:streptogramin lyase